MSCIEPWWVAVVPASVQDREGAKLPLHSLSGSSKKIRRIWVDGGYWGKLYLDFLGVLWDDAVPRFQETALKRVYIRTPSYHQVVQSLYMCASGRWKNYQGQMELVLHVLQPWAEALDCES